MKRGQVQWVYHRWAQFDKFRFSIGLRCGLWRSLAYNADGGPATVEEYGERRMLPFAAVPTSGFLALLGRLSYSNFGFQNETPRAALQQLTAALVGTCASSASSWAFYFEPDARVTHQAAWQGRRALVIAKSSALLDLKFVSEFIALRSGDASCWRMAGDLMRRLALPDRCTTIPLLFCSANSHAHQQKARTWDDSSLSCAHGWHMNSDSACVQKVLLCVQYWGRVICL